LEGLRMAGEVTSIPVGDDLEVIPMDQQISQTVEEAEAHLAVINRVMTVALKRTFTQDWIDFGGKPYLTAGGAERLAGLFRIEITGLEVKRYDDRDDHGPYFYYVVSGHGHLRVRVGQREIDHSLSSIGTCSARDQFFSSRKNEAGERFTIPASEVDQT